MGAYVHMLRWSLITLALLDPISGRTSAVGQSISTEETVHSVRRMLERLPYYGVFDYIVFRIDAGTVYLAGYSFESRLKANAEMAARRASGVVEVANKIEVLPASPNDDRIRWATFYRIYTDDFLARYALGALRELLLDLVWNHDFLGDSRLVDVAVGRLRAKVERDPAAPELVLTVRGVGYKAAK